MPAPNELILTTRVARQYYLAGRSKTEIADELGISRFRVARLLDSALSSGLVRIEIESPGNIDTSLSVELQKAYGLHHAVVIDVAGEDTTALRRHLGQAAADLLTEIVTADDVLGLAWARSLSNIGSSLTRFVPCQVVQLTGALSIAGGSDVLELVRGVASAGGGRAHVYYAPIVVGDAATARSLHKQPDIARVTALTSQVTIAVVGVGAWKPGLSTIFDTVDEAARARAAQQGVVAEISGVFVGVDGRPVTTPLSRRIIGMSADDLDHIPDVLAVAYGDAKADAVRAALTGGLVTGIITHASLARLLLGGITTDGAPPADPVTAGAGTAGPVGRSKNARRSG